MKKIEIRELFLILLAIQFVTDGQSALCYSGAIDFVDGANLSVEYIYDGNGLREAPEHQLERKSLTSDANKGFSPRIEA